MLLADQDRTRWHHDEIAEATRLLAAPSLAGPLTPLAASYAVQARIAAEHAAAPTPEDTRWDRIVGWCDLLLQVMPSPSARLARAGDVDAARAAYDQAIAACRNQVEREFLVRRREELDAGS